MAQISAALPIAMPAIPYASALFDIAGAAGDPGTTGLPAASKTAVLTPGAPLTLALPEATLTVILVESKLSTTLELGTIITVPSLSNWTVAKLTCEVVSCAPDRMMLPVIASAPFTMTGRLLVVINFPSKTFALPASFAVRAEDTAVPLAKTQTLVTARRTSKEIILTGRALSRMVFIFPFLGLKVYNNPPVFEDVLWGSRTLRQSKLDVKQFLRQQVLKILH
jgi:hypothetical protein